MNAGDPSGKYYGSGAGVAVRLLRRYPYEWLRGYWESLGLICREERDGRVYPASGYAASVVDVLRANAEGAGVELLTGHAATGIVREKNGFTVRHGVGEVRVDRVVVATGGKAGVGGNDSTGYNLLKGLGVKITELSPALAPIKVDANDIRGLKGVRARAKVTLRRDGKKVASEGGEILFSNNHVSGIAAMTMARHVRVGEGGGGAAQELSIDLMPERGVKEWREWFESREYRPGEMARDVMRGLVHPSIAKRLVRAAGVDEDTEAVCMPWGRVSGLLRDWRLAVKGVEGFQNAQVTAGGADMSAFRGDTLECKGVPGLFAAGEALDTDGACGGFNLMWAWVSGITAGEAAAE
jgi:predicted Rossmann fold flavoprotein